MKKMNWKRLLAGVLCVSMLGSQVSWAASGNGTAVPGSVETALETADAGDPGAAQAGDILSGSETAATVSDAERSAEMEQTDATAKAGKNAAGTDSFASPSDAVEYETDPETGEILDGTVFDDINEATASSAAEPVEVIERNLATSGLYSVILDKNDGSGEFVELSASEEGVWVGTPGNYGFVRDGYNAVGWSRRREAKPTDRDVFHYQWFSTVTEDQTLYVIWAKECRVTVVDSRSGNQAVYDCGEGDVLDVTYSDLEGVFGVPVRDQGVCISGLCSEKPEDPDAFVPKGTSFRPRVDPVTPDMILYTVYAKGLELEFIYDDVRESVYVNPKSEDHQLGWDGSGFLNAEDFALWCLGERLEIGTVNRDEGSEYYGKILAGWNVNDAVYYHSTVRVAGDVVITPEYQSFHTVTVRDENDDLINEYRVKEGQFIRLDQLDENLRPNYKIVGWNRKRNASADDPGFITNGIYTPTEDVTLYPVYGERMYLIGYYLDAEANPEEEEPYIILGTEPGDPIPVLSEEYNRVVGYRDMYQDGFRVVEDPEAGIVYGGDYVPAGNVRLLANWQPYFASVKVMYNTEYQEYGTGYTAFNARKEGDPVFLNSANLETVEWDCLSRYGMKLAGFSDSSHGEILYGPGESFRPAGDMTLYMIWEPADPSAYAIISFDPNGGRFEDLWDEALLWKGEPLSSLSQFSEGYPLKDGFSFTGWYLDEACTIPADPGMHPESNLKLYAGWSEGVRIRWVMYPYDSVSFALEWNQPYNTWQAAGISPILPQAAYREETLGQITKIGGDSWFLGVAHKGWRINGEFYEDLSDYTVTGETLIEAVWTSEDTVTLTFRVDEGYLHHKMAYGRKTAVYSVPRGGRFLTDLRLLLPAQKYSVAVSTEMAAGWATEEDPWTPVDFSTAVFEKDTVLHPLWKLQETILEIALDRSTLTLTAGASGALTAEITPPNPTADRVVWTSSDPSVVAVDDAGNLKALKGGTAVITAASEKDPSVEASCEVKVLVPVTSVKINTQSKVMLAGKTFQLAAWPQPSTATNKKVTWTSSNPAVAKVSSTGVVTGVKNGTAVITVKTADGGFTATCRITVGIPVTSVKINTTSKVVATGKTFQLVAWPQPSTAADRTVTWTSSNKAVATVSSTGLVKGVKAGTATITVKTNDGGHTATCRITVGIPVTSVKINTTSKVVATGKTFQLAAWPQPSTAADRTVTWTSSNKAVATVSSTGLVKGVKAGTATITVKTNDGGHTATCRITVGIPVNGVKINTTAKTVEPGKTFQLAAWPQPSTAANKKVTWTSSNKAVATVSSTGLVKGIKAGTATITVKTADGGYTASCRITVKTATVHVTSVKINTTAKTIAAGKTFQLAAWPQPSTAANKKVTWTSSNKAVATVSSTGLVKGLKKGTAVITVKTADGGKTATCRITVQ